jgi:hypothetical protein
MRRPWLLVLYGAAAAGGARAGDRLRRTSERPLAGNTDERIDSVAILDQLEPVTERRRESTLIDDLLAQARLADELERTQVHSEPLQVYEVAVWRGYFTWQFYVASQETFEASHSSPYFRARGREAPEPTDAALRTQAALVEQLTAAGWEPDGRGEHWFSERFRRPSV